LSPIKHIESSSQISLLNDKINGLEKEKKQLEAKVEKCTSIVKELEDFYTKEIDRLNE
jgi:prefoldin subunit 5